jgi:hypothetical protein
MIMMEINYHLFCWIEPDKDGAIAVDTIDGTYTREEKIVIFFGDEGFVRGDCCGNSFHAQIAV